MAGMYFYSMGHTHGVISLQRIDRTLLWDPDHLDGALSAVIIIIPVFYPEDIILLATSPVYHLLISSTLFHVHRGY